MPRQGMLAVVLAALCAVLACVQQISGSSLLETRKTAPPPPPDLLNAQISDLRKGLQTGRWTSVDLVKAYIARINEVNTKGPALNAVTEIATTALKQAAAADAARKKGQAKGNLHGIPIIVKDNIATHVALGMNTTAGSYSLVNSVPPRDSTVAANLLDAGAILLGKASMSVWAFYRGSNLTEGWSPRAGFVTSAWYPGASACSSSAGSGVIASIGLAAGTLGSETDGSIICPSNYNGVVGIKPTVSHERQKGVIPISFTQDSPGPIVNSVSNAAEVLTAMFGKGSPDFTKSLQKNALKGMRIGVLGSNFTNATYQGYDPSVNTLYKQALATMKAHGAVLVPTKVASVENGAWDDFYGDGTVLAHEIKVAMAEYLQGLSKVPTGVRTLQDLIDFDDANPNLELPGKENTQDLFTGAEATDGIKNKTYLAAVAKNKRLCGPEGIDGALKQYKVDVLVAPSSSYLYSMAARIGYPVLSVPMGYMSATAGPDGYDDPPFPFPHAPAGLAFTASANSEATLLRAGYGYEQASMERIKRTPRFTPKTQISDVQRH